MQVSVRRIPLLEASGADLDRWGDLASRALEPNVSVEPDFILPLAKVSCDPDSSLLIVARGSRTLLAAVIVKEARKAGPLQLPVWSTSSDFMERETGHSYPLVDAEEPEAAFEAWFAHCRTQRLGGTLWIPELYEDGAMGAALRSVLARRRLPHVTFGRGYVPYVTAGDWPAIEPSDGRSVISAAHLPRARRQEANRSLRRIEETFGELPRPVDLTADPAAIDAFVTLQAAGWKGDAARGGMALGLSAERTAAFHEITSTFRRLGRLHVSALVVGTQRLHMSVSLRAATGAWFTAFDAYDENFAHLGVGRIGRIALLQELATRYPNSDIDPCYKGDSHAVVGMFPQRRPAVGVLVGAGGVSSRMAVKAIAAREARK